MSRFSWSPRDDDDDDDDNSKSNNCCSSNSNNIVVAASCCCCCCCCWRCACAFGAFWLTNLKSIYVTIWLLPGKNVANFAFGFCFSSLFDNARRDICNRSKLQPHGVAVAVAAAVAVAVAVAIAIGVGVAFSFSFRFSLGLSFSLYVFRL